jgi:hypothetical protein
MWAVPLYSRGWGVYDVFYLHVLVFCFYLILFILSFIHPFFLYWAIAMNYQLNYKVLNVASVWLESLLDSSAFLAYVCFDNATIFAFRFLLKKSTDPVTDYTPAFLYFNPRATCTCLLGNK